MGTVRQVQVTFDCAEPERVAPVCPTCFTTLAGTGRCDYCD